MTFLEFALSYGLITFSCWVLSVVDCARAARDIGTRLPSRGLELNEDESVAFIRNWHACAECDTPWSELCGEVDDVCIRYAQNGIKVVGVPLGTRPFINNTLDVVCDKLESELEKISVIRDGVMFLQLLRFCETGIPGLITLLVLSLLFYVRSRQRDLTRLFFGRLRRTVLYPTWWIPRMLGLLQWLVIGSGTRQHVGVLA